MDRTLTESLEILRAAPPRERESLIALLDIDKLRRIATREQWREIERWRAERGKHDQG